MYRSFALTVAVALAASANAKADFIIDFNGAGGAGTTRSGVTSFDYLPGNLLSGAASPAPGTNFDAYFQGIVGSLGAPNPSIPAGFEITVVGTINETAGAVVGGTQTFAVNGGSFSIYLDNTPDANPSTGTGFNNGTLILSGTIGGAALNNFTVALDAMGNPTLVAFNQTPNPGNNSGSGNAVVGAGVFLSSGSLVTFFDPNFIILGAGESFTSTSFAGTTESFFDFGLNAPSTSFAEAGSPFAPNIGNINVISGPRAQFEIDANQSFTFQQDNIVPEPASLAAFALMMGAGALGLRRKGRKIA